MGMLAVVPPATAAWHMQLRVSGEFEVQAARSAEVCAEVEGFLDQVYVREGDVVDQGQVLARLSDRTYRAELEQIEAQLRQREAQLRKLEAGPRPEEAALAQATLQTARAKFQQATQRHGEAMAIRTQRLAQAQATKEKSETQLKYSQERLTRQDTLFQRKVVTEADLRGAQETREVRERELAEVEAALRTVEVDRCGASSESLVLAERECDDAQCRLDLLLSGSRSEDVAAARAEIDALAARRDFVQRQLERVQIKSPLAGIVTTRKLANQTGKHLAVGDLVVQIEQLDHVMVELAIPECEVGDIAVGHDVALKARAYPEKLFHGKVMTVSATTVRLEEQSDARIVTISSRIENRDLLLKPGMTGKAKITCGERKATDLAMRRLARTLRVEFWSWW
jgi:HlyD family secretion protein